MTFVTRAGKMSRNAHRLIMSYRQNKWEYVIFLKIGISTKNNS